LIFHQEGKKVHDYVCVALRDVANEVEGCGFFEDEVADVKNGQTQNMQQSF
jgi:hypothetical protein